VNRNVPSGIWVLAFAFIAIEALLQLSDIGLLTRGLRGWAYDHFAFHAVLFHAIESGQQIPWTLYLTFVTHALLHGGLLHLAMNTAIFLALGAHLGRAVGGPATVLLFLGSVLGGAFAFGLLTVQDQQFIPMVGASGGIFGMLGAMKRWEWRFISRNNLPKRRFWTTVLVFAAINVILSLGSGVAGGGIAWEAHLGGFVAGWLAAGFLNPRHGAWVGPI
jgi:membrane associated rhomboid family serine protease